MSFGGRRMNLGAVKELVGGLVMLDDWLEAGRRGWQRLVLRED